MCRKSGSIWFGLGKKRNKTKHAVTEFVRMLRGSDLVQLGNDSKVRQRTCATRLRMQTSANNLEMFWWMLAASSTFSAVTKMGKRSVRLPLIMDVIYPTWCSQFIAGVISRLPRGYLGIMLAGGLGLPARALPPKPQIYLKRLVPKIPGSSVSNFWERLLWRQHVDNSPRNVEAKAGVDTFTEFPYARWDLDQYYEQDADQNSGKSYTKHGGFSDGIELFDCRFFDISPAESRGMDPAQRQVLEVSYISLAGGGFSKKSLASKSEQVGVFVGLCLRSHSLL